MYADAKLCSQGVCLYADARRKLCSRECVCMRTDICMCCSAGCPFVWSIHACTQSMCMCRAWCRLALATTPTTESSPPFYVCMCVCLLPPLCMHVCVSSPSTLYACVCVLLPLCMHVCVFSYHSVYPRSRVSFDHVECVLAPGDDIILVRLENVAALIGQTMAYTAQQH